MPERKECRKSLVGEEPQSFKSEILEYRVHSTDLSIYFCQAVKTTKRCKESFFGVDHKRSSIKYVRVLPSQCRWALKAKTSAFGKLVQINDLFWTTQNKKFFKCRWEATTSESYTDFSINKYSATLVGEDTIIKQTITGSNCRVSKRFCFPKEQRRKGVIIWDKPEHNFHLYHTLGTQLVTQLGDFMLINTLGV